ncbi:MAG TPA: hypothetical protein PL009_05475 [Flavipsychrobacter sp.]|nr:hypothetical protein [Flavipsychrobacter sp.]
MQPAKFSDKDRKDAASLIKTYPYFVATRYVEAAEHHKKQPFAPALMNMMQLYKGNWLLFHDYMQSSTGSGYSNTPITVATDEEDDISDELDSSSQTEFDDVITFGDYEEEVILEEDKSENEAIAQEILEEEEPFAFISEEVVTEAPLPEAKQLEKKPEETPVVQKARKKEAAQKSAPEKPEPKIEEPKIEEVTVELPENENEEEVIPVETTQESIVVPPAETKEAPVKKEHTEKRKDEIPLFYQHRKNDSLIQPIYTEDYFLHQGLHVSDELSEDHQQKEKDKSLMVVMSFSEWLLHLKTKGEREKEEKQDQKALKTMWQKEKLAAALEEENDEIPETVFEMAVNSITKEEDLASESLADILVKQGKSDKAIDMYRKLSLRNPQKKTYFARKIDELQKEKES